MAFDFPASPVTGEVYTPVGGPSYQWDGEKWKGGGVAREPDEQFFDLSGLTQKDIVVPTWARGCKIEGVIFVGQANWPTMRWSGDGSTFLAGASDYSNSGPFHGTGTSLYQTTPVAATDKINLSLGGDNIAYAQVFTTKFNLTRPSTSQVFSVKTYSKALDSAAAQRERTFWHTAYNSGANWTASILAIKAIRIGLGNAGSFAAGSFLLVKWLGDTGQLPLIPLAGFKMFPPGITFDYWGPIEPPGALFAYGQAISRTTYAALFAILGTTFGVGDGSTTFNLPDLRGRVVAGKDDMGGTAANRLQTAWGVNGAQLGASGGGQSHVLTTAQLPTVLTGSAGAAGGATGAAYTGITTGTGGGAINNTGGGQGHPNVQPTIVGNKIMTTGGV